MEHIHILVATPCYNNSLNTNYVNSLLDLKDVCNLVGIKMTVRLLGNESLITRGRNYYVNMMLTHKEYTHLLYIDSDIGYIATSILNMIKLNKDIVGIPYPKKSINWESVIKNATKENMNPDLLQVLSMDYVVNFLNSEAKIEKGFIECSYIGTGMMLIKREVIEVMKEKYIHTKYRNDVGGYNEGDVDKENFFALFDCFICPEEKRYLSEDYAFCKRAKECGFKIYADLNSHIIHLGSYPFLGHFGSHIMNIVNENNYKIKKVEEPVIPLSQSTPVINKEKKKFVNSI